MQKNNIRNFICSFLFSVLAVAAVQKVFFHRQKPAETNVEPVKTEKISLFSENNDFPEISDDFSHKSAPIDVSEIAALTAPKLEETPEISQTASVDVPVSLSKSEEPSVSTDLQNADEIHLENSLNEKEEPISSPIIYADATENSAEEIIPLTQTSQSKYTDSVTVSTQTSASQIAMVEPETLISRLEEPDILEETKDLADADIKSKELGSVLDITKKETPDTAEEDASLENESPWVVAKGNKYAKNQAVIQEFENAVDPLSKDEEEAQNVQNVLNAPLLQEKKNDTKLAYQMIQNILIPIPEDVMNDMDMTPHLSETPNGSSDDDEENPQLSENSEELSEKPKNQNKPVAELNDDEKESGLFKRISSWFGTNKKPGPLSGSGEKIAQSVSEKAIKTAGNIKGKVFSALGSIEDYKHTEAPSIMPAELRLSFQPNRAEISGRTLRWIYAFADNARDNDGVYVEVRIDGTSSYALQQKRLNLLSSIFSARGVDYRKINTIFTSREPNSFIIRNIHFNNKEETNEQK